MDMSNEIWGACPALIAWSFSSLTMKCDAPLDLRQTFDAFRNKAFLIYQAQTSPQYVLLKTYDVEESVSWKHVKCAPLNNIPANDNNNSSHTVYKANTHNGGPMRLKTKSEPHENENLMKYIMGPK